MSSVNLHIMNSERILSFENKSFPEYIKREAQTALSFYPELEEVPITFLLKDKATSSVMKAQPRWTTLFRPKEQREYVIIISRNFNIQGKEFDTALIPKKVLIGWLGHELGHIMDYTTRSSLNLIGFGIMYLMSPSYTRKAELTADRFAVHHNMQDYILETKNYILNHADLSNKYKEKIKRLYASPEQILDIVKERTS